MKTTTLTSAAAIALTAAVAFAGSLDLDAVSQDATWLVHVDVERFNESTLGRFVTEHGDDLDLDMDDLDEMEEKLGLNLRDDLMSVTLYGSGDHEDEGVAVAVMSSRIDDALERLARIEGVEHHRIDLDGYPVHAFSWDGEHHYIHVRDRRHRDRRVVVIAEDKNLLLDACRVVDGRGKSMTRAKSPLSRAKPRRGSIVFVAATDVEMFEDIEPASEIARLTDAVVIDIGERKEHVYAHATVSAGGAEDARDIVQVMQGMLALGRLVSGEDEDLRPLRDLIRSVDVDSEGSRISVTFEYPVRELLEGLEAIDAEDWD